MATLLLFGQVREKGREDDPTARYLWLFRVYTDDDDDDDDDESKATTVGKRRRSKELRERGWVGDDGHVEWNGKLLHTAE